MKNKSFWLRFLAGGLVVFSTPFLVTRLVENPPDMTGVVSAAVKFTDSGIFTKDEITGLSSGSLILYTPKKPAGREEDTEQAPQEITEESTAEIEEQDQQILPQTEEVTAEEYLITQNISEDREDLSVYSNFSGKVSVITYTANQGANYLNLPSGAQVRNCTELDNDYVMSEMSVLPDFKIEAYSDEPQVLIMHTHTSESYLLEGEYYDENYTSRTSDPNQSVVAVGERISIKLAEAGICTIHDGTVHDSPYKGSYDRSAETVSAILAQYPSIKVVLDIHRDGIVQPDGTWVSAVCDIDGREAAQVMIISAAGGGGYYVPDYIQNFHLACLLQDSMEAANPGITRPVLLDYCQYNQNLSTGSLLIEVGSHGNTLEQALYSGDLIGKSIAEALLTLT